MFGPGQSAAAEGPTPSLANSPFPSVSVLSCADKGSNKRKRRPAGTPDPDAEVISLSPKTLLESDRYVCEICNQGFQRDQNLQMHRRRHKVPWKLLKRETPEIRKRVFVCPEPTCLHHDPCHALGDLVGIKKHFRRKHSNHKQWTCEKCSKAYAVQSDYKAHLKTCGTRGHSCDCGRVFSRVESFIEHQDVCSAGRDRQEQQVPLSVSLSRTASTTSPSSDTNFSAPNWSAMKISSYPSGFGAASDHYPQNLELQLLPTSNNHPTSPNPTNQLLNKDGNQSTILQLSIGSGHEGNKPAIKPNQRPELSWLLDINKPLDELSLEQQLIINQNTKNSPSIDSFNIDMLSALKLKEQARDQLQLATAEKTYAEEIRQRARLQIELAEKEFADAKRIRQLAQDELLKARLMRDQAIKQVNSIMLQITCQSCKHHFQAAAQPSDQNSLAIRYVSSVAAEGLGENGNKHPMRILSL
ncbi:indeterminate-domain 14 protein [Nymphaea thermarum]|nr:indeterminate-domain 14 protein [Nymphaea thermarum]